MWGIGTWRSPVSSQGQRPSQAFQPTDLPWTVLQLLAWYRVPAEKAERASSRG